MKFLLLFLLSFNIFAGYSPDCASGKKGFFRSKSKCESINSETCYKYPVGYSCEYHVVIDELINDLDNPIYEAESNNIICVDEETCAEELANLICPSEDHMKIIELNYSQVYCTKLLGYQQKLSGNKVVKEDPVKKAAYDLDQKDKKDKEKADKDAKKLAKDYFKSVDCSTLLTPFEINACNFIKR